VTLDEVPQPVAATWGDQIDAHFASRRAWTGACWRPPGGCGRTCGCTRCARQTEDGWYAETQVLQQEAGLRWSGSVDAYGATLLAGCDGTRPLGDLLAVLASSAGISQDEAAEQVLPGGGAAGRAGLPRPVRVPRAARSRPPRLLLLTGCFGDSPPDPGSAPLEVVVGSSMKPEEPCLLNRPEVAAGQHEVSLLNVSGARRAWSYGPRPERCLRVRRGGEAGAAQGSVALSVGEHPVQYLSKEAVLGEVRLQVMAAGM
jgi:hypothetical protein